MDKTTVIDVTGKLTIGHDAKMRRAVAEALEAGARRILLNLERVNQVDSSGIGELVAAHTSVSRSGGRLILVGLPSRLATVLQITQLMGVLESYDDATQALAALDDEAG